MGTIPVRYFTPLLLAVLSLLLFCNASTTDISGNSTQTGNGKTIALKGLIFEPDGTTPAPQAKITIRQMSTNDLYLAKVKTETLTVYTDVNGNFFCNLQKNAAFYSMKAERGDSMYAMTSWMWEPMNDTFTMIIDTLKPPGSLRCVVDPDTLQYIQKGYFELVSSTRFITFADSHILTNIEYHRASMDSTYEFFFENLPEGEYTARISAKFSPDMEPVLFKRIVYVTSDQLTDLDTFQLTDGTTPFITSQQTGYDELSGKNQITWSWYRKHLDSTRIRGVNIYDYNPATRQSIKLNDLVVQDTVFVDSGFWNPPRRPALHTFVGIDEFGACPDSIAMRVIYPMYHIVPVNQNGDEMQWRIVHTFNSIFWKAHHVNPFMPDLEPLPHPAEACGDETGHMLPYDSK